MQKLETPKMEIMCHIIGDNFSWLNTYKEMILQHVLKIDETFPYYTLRFSKQIALIQKKCQGNTLIITAMFNYISYLYLFSSEKNYLMDC